MKRSAYVKYLFPKEGYTLDQVEHALRVAVLVKKALRNRGEFLLVTVPDGKP